MNEVRRESDDSVSDETDKQLGRLVKSLAGQRPSFHVESSDTVIGNMPVELLVFDATDVEFNVRELFNGGKAQIKSFGTAKLTLRISTSSLKSQLVQLCEQEGLKEVQISFDDNSVKVTAKRKVKLIGNIKLSAKAKFFVVGASSIGLKVTEVESGQFNVGTSKLKLDFNETVPPLNLGGMFATVVIDKLELNSGWLQVTAHAVELGEDRAPVNAIDVL